MGIFSKLFKGPQIDMEKSNANAQKMRTLFNSAVEMCIRDRASVPRKPFTGDVGKVYIGIDAGSTTVKAAVIDLSLIHISSRGSIRARGRWWNPSKCGNRS